MYLLSTYCAKLRTGRLRPKQQESHRKLEGGEPLTGKFKNQIEGNMQLGEGQVLVLDRVVRVGSLQSNN